MQVCHLDALTRHNSAAQHSTAQHSTAQHSTAQHRTAQHSTAQHGTAQDRTAQHGTAQQYQLTHSFYQSSWHGVLRDFEPCRIVPSGYSKDIRSSLTDCRDKEI